MITKCRLISETVEGQANVPFHVKTCICSCLLQCKHVCVVLRKSSQVLAIVYKSLSPAFVFLQCVSITCIILLSTLEMNKRHVMTSKSIFLLCEKLSLFVISEQPKVLTRGNTKQARVLKKFSALKTKFKCFTFQWDPENECAAIHLYKSGSCLKETLKKTAETDYKCGCFILGACLARNDSKIWQFC